MKRIRVYRNRPAEGYGKRFAVRHAKPNLTVYWVGPVVILVTPR